VGACEALSSSPSAAKKKKTQRIENPEMRVDGEHGSVDAWNQK
jgi:hypothetical protein